MKFPLSLDQDWLLTLQIFFFFVCGSFLLLMIWLAASIVDASEGLFYGAQKTLALRI
ncbi:MULTISPECIES: hypothetical protein [Comamonas]|uniref:hypothetical protein n=1 Tax=Comamonas TaxID=283 RepID=UPI0012D7391E|nr:MULTISPECIES: hypothetical protein [Comamonas]MDN5538960.1 hypothetical protein [Comamonas sp.]